MKTLFYFSTLMLLTTSCSQKIYYQDYTDFSNPVIAEIIEESLLEAFEDSGLITYRDKTVDLDNDYTHINYYRFQMYDCEVSYGGLFERELVTLDQCEGKIYGIHNFDLIELIDSNNTALIPHAFLYFSARRNENNDIIGPITYFAGIYFEEGYLQNMPYNLPVQNKHLSFKRRYAFKKGLGSKKSKKRHDLDFMINEVNFPIPMLTRNAPYIQLSAFPVVYLYKVIYRSNNKIGGGKPISFELQEVLNQEFFFYSVSRDDIN